jgi:hypothetical protein
MAASLQSGMSDEPIDECCNDASCCSDTESSESCCSDTASAGGCCGGSGAGGCCGGKSKALEPMTPEQLEAMPSLALISRYRRGIENIDRRVFDLTERQIDMAFLPDAGVGLWPIRVLIGHCADADLAVVHRMRRAVAEDSPVVAAWDENAFVDANIYGNDHPGYADTPEGDHARVMQALGGHLAVIHTLRQWIGQWLISLDDAQLNREVMHPQKGPMSVRRMVAYYTWHLEHHCGYLTKKLDRIAGPVAAKKSGCGSGCGCG